MTTIQNFKFPICCPEILDFQQTIDTCKPNHNSQFSLMKKNPNVIYSAYFTLIVTYGP